MKLRTCIVEKYINCYFITWHAPYNYKITSYMDCPYSMTPQMWYHLCLGHFFFLKLLKYLTPDGGHLGFVQNGCHRGSLSWLPREIGRLWSYLALVQNWCLWNDVNNHGVFERLSPLTICHLGGILLGMFWLFHCWVISLLSCILPSIMSSLVSSFPLSMFIGGIVDIIVLFVVCFFCSFYMFVIASLVFTLMSLVPIIISVVRCFAYLMRCLVVNILSRASILHCGSFFSIWAMAFVLTLGYGFCSDSVKSLPGSGYLSCFCYLFHGLVVLWFMWACLWFVVVCLLVRLFCYVWWLCPSPYLWLCFLWLIC